MAAYNHVLSCVALLLMMPGRGCYGFGLFSSSSSSSVGVDGSKILEKSNLLVEIGPANLPRDLPKIQACREAAFVDKSKADDDNDQEVNLLRSQRSFVDAEAAVRGDSICVVARERFPPFQILGTADVSSKEKLNGAYLIQNVFVVPEARGRGLAQRLVQGAEQLAVAASSDTTDTSSASKDAPVKVSLTVETSNTPAVSLYQKCDYEAEGIDALLLAVGQSTGFPLITSMVKEIS